MNPFAHAVRAYILIEVLVLTWSALDASGLVAALPGSRWLRVHFLTLGIVGQAAVGRMWHDAIPDHSAPHGRLFTLWNAGVAILAIAIPMVWRPGILAGGVAIVSALALVATTIARRPRADPARAFDVAAIAFLAVGALVGTGIWLGWSDPLRIASARETHIHANVWGFASMAFASWLARWVASRRGVAAAAALARAAFPWMAVGAALLIAGPWVGFPLAMGSGLLAYAIGTVRLLLGASSDLRQAGGAGARHVLWAYAWLAAPLIGAPFVVLSAGSPLARAIESEAPQAVLFGWMMPLAIALIPALTARASHSPGDRLGGTRATLWLVNAGTLLWWLAIVAPPLTGALRGTALAAYASSLLLASGALTRARLVRRD